MSESDVHTSSVVLANLENVDVALGISLQDEIKYFWLRGRRPRFIISGYINHHLVGVRVRMVVTYLLSHVLQVFLTDQYGHWTLDRQYRNGNKKIPKCVKKLFVHRYSLFENSNLCFP